MRLYVQGIVALTVCAVFLASFSPRVFAQGGSVQVGSNPPASSVDLIAEIPSNALIFSGATGPGDAGVAVANSDTIWSGDILLSSDGRFQSGNNYLNLTGNIVGTGDMILDGNEGSLFRIHGDMNSFDGDIYWNNGNTDRTTIGLAFGENLATFFGDIHINTLNAGTGNVLDINVANDTDYSGQIWGDSDSIFRKAGSGVLVLANAGSNYFGAVDVYDGELQVLSDNFGSTLLSVGSTRYFDMSGTTQSYQRIEGEGTIIVGNGSLTVGSDTQASTFSGKLEGNGTFTKTGSEAVTMSENTTFSGTVNVNQGTLAMYSNIYYMGLHVDGGATFNNNNRDQGTHGLSGSGTILLGDDQSRMVISNNTDNQFDGKIIGSGTITKTAPGDLTLTNLDGSFDGAFDVVGGKLIVTSNNAGNSLLNISAGGTFDMSGTTQSYQQLSGNGLVLLGDGSLTIGSDTDASRFSGSIFGDDHGSVPGAYLGSLTKTGTTSLTLENGGGINAGQFNVDQGEFVMQGGSNLIAYDGNPDYNPTMTIASGASMRLSPTAAGAPVITNTMIDAQGALIMEMRDYPKIATLQRSVFAMDPNNVVFEGISYLDPSDVRTIEFLDIDVYEMQTALELWTSMFDKPLVNVQLDNAGGNDYEANINAVSLSSFAGTAGGFTQNQLSEIADMETERLDWGIDSDRRDVFENLYNSSDAYAILRSLTTATDETNEVADAVASLNIGQASLLGDIAFSTSSHWVGKNMRTTGGNLGGIVRGQSSTVSGTKPILYFQPYYRSVKTDTRGIVEGYGIDKTGFLAGGTLDTDSTTSVGFLFGYSNPELHQSDRELNMNDLHVGMMAVKVLPRNFDLGLLFSMGWQEGNSRRDVWGPNAAGTDMIRYRFRGDLSGHTFNATANLGKRIEIGKHFTFKPTIGLDYEGTRISPFTEKINGGSVYTGTIYDNLLARRSYGDSSFNRVLFKVGAAGSWSGSQGGISGKVLYGTQLGGSDVAKIDATILDGVFAGDSRHYTSIPIGRDFIYLEGGMHRYVNEKKTALLYASYNTTLYSFTTEQTVLLGFQWTN